MSSSSTHASARTANPRWLVLRALKVDLLADAEVAEQRDPRGVPVAQEPGFRVVVEVHLQVVCAFVELFSFMSRWRPSFAFSPMRKAVSWSCSRRCWRRSDVIWARACAMRSMSASCSLGSTSFWASPSCH